MCLYYGVFGILVLFNFVLNDEKPNLRSHYWTGKNSINSFILDSILIYLGLFLNSLGSTISYNHINFKALMGWGVLEIGQIFELVFIEKKGRKRNTGEDISQPS